MTQPVDVEIPTPVPDAHVLNRPSCWAVVLAGGEGIRLRSLLRQVLGDDRPKQYARLLGPRSLLRQTLDRISLAISDGRTLVVTVRQHAGYISEEFAGIPHPTILPQPLDRGTAAGILYPMLRLAARAPGATVAVLPSDHHFSDEARFMARVESAFDAVAVRPDRLVLLGMVPDTAEPEYGWIEPGDLLALGKPRDLYRVARFWEKPAARLAEALRRRGCLWNSFVMVGRPRAFLDLYRANAPELLRAFQPVLDTLGTAREATVAERVYAALSPVDFSQRLLAAGTRLGVVRLKGVAWSDLGTVERLAATLRHTGVRPRWLDALRLPG